MSDWDVVSEKPSSPDDWSVASEVTPKQDSKDRIKAGLPHVIQAFKDYGPDVAKSLGSGIAEGAVGLVTAPLDLGSRVSGYLTNKAMGAVNKNNQPGEYMPSVTEGIVGALGMEHEPTTTPGSIAKIAGNFVPGVGAVSGGAKALAAKGAKAIEGARDASSGFTPPRVVNPQTKAAEAVASRLQQGAVTPGGVSPQEAIKRVQAARAAGVDLSLADVSEPVRKLAGSVGRRPGEGQNIVRGFLTKRDEEAANRLTANIDENLAKGSVRQTVSDVADARSKQAGPLFEEAYRGGSIAPLEKQYESEFNTASKAVQEHSQEVSKLLNKVTTLKAKLATNKDVYVGAATARELKEAEGALSVKEIELKQANDDKEDILGHLRTAQTDASTKAPGAVWNPRIARLVKNPIVQKGINEGVRIERNLADAEGRVFNPKEYAIIGEKDGEPIVGKVPNMRLLASAKEGLDGILSSPAMRDPMTGRLTKEGRSVDKLRRALIKELDTVNPKYKEARDLWAGHSASINAVDFGRKAFTGKPEDIAAEIEQMSPSEKEFARLGLADTLREKILKTGLGGDEAKAVIKSPWMREQMRPFFANDAAFNKFVNAVSDERAMFKTKFDVMGGSQTQERAMEDKANDARLALKAGRGLVDAARGSYFNVVHTLLNLRSDLALRNNPKLNEAIAKLMFDPKADLSQIEKALPKVNTNVKPNVGVPPKQPPTPMLRMTIHPRPAGESNGQGNTQ